ncbi:MAG TPA: type IV secretion system DNA-binding domain-containing protein [Candidatus Paceibacterota bacterium]
MKPDFNKDIVYLGTTNFRGREKTFGIKNNDRFQHMYVIGQTGTGKTTLLKNIAIQDVKAGRGITIIDPHGEFVDDILASIPDYRLDDVIYFDPVDTDYPIGFNILEAKEPEYKHLISSGLMSVFTKIWANVWSARMEYILNNTVLAVIDTPGATLLSILRMLVDKSYRQYVVNNCQDPMVRSFWVNEYEQYEPRFRTEAIAPIQNKVGQFLSSHIIRNIVGQTKSTLDIAEVMNKGKILLVNVSKGKVGEDNSALLGAMLITKIQLAAMERVRIKQEDRRDFILFIDEFQNFVTDSFASILSEARKYRLGMVISHQYIGQLITEQTGERLKDAVFGNVGTTITFRVSAQDAEYLEKHYAPYLLADDLIGLPNYQVYMKIMIGGTSSRPFSANTLPPIKVIASPEHKQFIIDNSRRNYARRRDDVEANIASWAGSRGGETPPKKEVPSTWASGVAGIGTAPAKSKTKYSIDLKAPGVEGAEEAVGSSQITPAGRTSSPTFMPNKEISQTTTPGPPWYKVDQAPKPVSKWPKKRKPAGHSQPQPPNSNNKPPLPGTTNKGPNYSLRDALNKALGIGDESNNQANSA